MTPQGSDIFAGGGLPEGLTQPELEAARWLARLTSGDAGAAEQADFRAWCARSAGNRAAFRAAHRLWQVAGPALRATRKPVPRTWPALALAASLMLAVTLGHGVLGRRSGEAVGSHPVLRLDASQGHCRLLLGAGEESFDVTPSAGAVPGGAADETEVRVGDAAFSLKPYASGLLVTVNSGRVEASAGRGMKLMPAGQQMSCNVASRAAQDGASARRSLTWYGQLQRMRALRTTLVSTLGKIWPAWRVGDAGAPMS